MELRVAVYAEGPAEDVGSAATSRAPGFPLDETDLGPAHVLVERCLRAPVEATGIRIRFVAPSRKASRRALGSDLHVPRVLRKLLTSQFSERGPHLAIVLVDSDGDTQRRTALVSGLNQAPLIPQPRVVGAAHQAFEAWLLGDLQALRTLTSADIPTVGSPEALSASDVKQTLNDAIAKVIRHPGGRGRELLHPGAVRCELARIVSLDALRRQKSFELFSKECADEAARAATTIAA